jgi:predicted nucleotidyltransferase
MVLIACLPPSTPATHARFLTTAVERLAADGRVAGLAAGGSLATDAMDEFSDLDLIIAADPFEYDALFSERRKLAESLGLLLAAFTGEHVFEPRLLICLYDGDPPLHVDLKFISLSDAATRVEDPLVLWERDGLLTRALSTGAAHYPAPDRQWIEDRFWVWVHYASTKIARGELFEAVGFLAYLRSTVLGPLALVRAGARPAGVRKLEHLAKKELELLRPTVSGLSRAECLSSLRVAVSAYRAFRSDDPSIVLREAAEAAAIKYVADIEASAA